MSERQPLIAANWKMNLNHFEAMKLVQELSYSISRDDVDAVDVLICVPFTDIRTVQTILDSDKIPFSLGAQNCHEATSGAYTGEISATMLAKLNVSYVLVGHSERREIYFEDNSLCNKKLKAVLKEGMAPVLCVGETLEERQGEQQSQVVSTQLSESLKGIKAEKLETLVVAYEPVWAIGTGEVASEFQAQEMCQFIRAQLTELYSADLADSLRILYGGSVKPANVADIMSQGDIDGALVGGASLVSDDFTKIVQYRNHMI